MTATNDPRPRSQGTAADLTAVAMIDAPACAAVGSMSVSWWHDEVRAGRAPKPVIQQPRCTRWRVEDVRAYWARRIEQAAADLETAAAVKAHANKASAAARAKRDANGASLASRATAAGQARASGQTRIAASSLATGA